MGQSWGATLVIALSACLGGGCGGGPKTYRVTGAVSYAGQPVEKGEISFVPLDGGAPDGGVIENGRYALRAKAGKKRVEIRGARALPANQFTDPEMGAVYEDYIPAAYNRESTLTAEITGSGASDLNFQLAPP